MSGTRDDGGRVVPWAVDPLTRAVFERTVAESLDPAQARALMEARDRAAVEAIIRALPDAARERLDAMSPILHVSEIHAPCIAFGHDRDDVVIPIGESRRLAAALTGRAGVSFTEYAMFQHADPTKKRLSPLAFVREVARFYGSLYPLFRRTV